MAALVTFILWYTTVDGRVPKMTNLKTHELHVCVWLVSSPAYHCTFRKLRTYERATKRFLGSMTLQLQNLVDSNDQSDCSRESYMAN